MTNAINELPATLRTSTGKGPSHKLRHAGLVPAIVYGGGKKATSVAVPPKETTKLLMTPLRRNVMVHLNLKNEKGTTLPTQTVMVRDLQIDPVRRNLIHVDFVEINPKEPVAVHVPLFLFGKSKAVVEGGKLDQIKQSLHVKVLPGNVPEKIELDVTDLGFGSTPASVVKLPKGVSLVDLPSTSIISIKIPRAEKEETPVVAAVAAAAPVAGATSPAAS